MMCQRCQKRQATVAYTQIVEDAKKTLHLCNACLPHGAPSPAAAPEPPQQTAPTSSSQAKSGAPGGVAIEPVEEGETVKCQTCGMSYEEFRKAARFGCHDCYAAFEPRLERLFKRVHGAAAHTGKGRSPKDRPAPTTTAELEQLEQQLQLAVATEDYEEAAQLRDRIGRLKSD